MSIESFKNSKQKLSDNLNKESEQVICKDGFCFLPNIDESKKINNNSNIFDPL